MITKRSVCKGIVLSILTCGIYLLYWIVCITNDVNAVSNEDSPSGILVVILGVFTCGLYFFIGHILWAKE